MVCVGSSRAWALNTVGQMVQKTLHAAAKSFKDIVTLAACEKVSQGELGVGLKPSLSWKLMVLLCSFMKMAPRTTV